MIADKQPFINYSDERRVLSPNQPQPSTNSRSNTLFRQLNLNVWSGQRIPSGLPSVKRKTISVVVFRFLLLLPQIILSTRESEHESTVLTDEAPAKS